MNARGQIVPFPTPATIRARVEGAYTLCEVADAPCVRCTDGWVRVPRPEGGEGIGRCRCRRPHDQVAAWNRAGVPAAHVGAVAQVEVEGLNWTPAQVPSLLVRGANGRGKSYLAAGALRWCTFVAGLRPLWIEHLDLVGRIRRKASARGQLEGMSSDDALGVGDYATAGVLVVDDARAYAPTDLGYQLLEELLCRRYDAQRPTIVTTNERHHQAFGPRLASRMETYQHIELCGDDRRRGARV